MHIEYVECFGEDGGISTNKVELDEGELSSTESLQCQDLQFP